MDRPPSVDSAANDGAPKALPGQPSAAPGRRRTLPPPEWLGARGPNSVSAIASGRIARGESVAHRRGARAELAWLFAHVEGARKDGDTAKERAYTTELARSLFERGEELDRAVRLGRRALLLGEDPVLRDELASWFALLGEFALAASTTRPLLTLDNAAADVGRLLTNIGSLFARAGEATAARDAFEEALARNPSDPNPAELVAALAAWAPHVVTPEDAARSYLSAAGLREAKGERAAAFEDLLRAFEIAPGSEPAAERLARVLSERGRAGAADEVRREHARYVGASSAQRVHERRFVVLLASGDGAGALAAALDARLEISNPELDTLLERLGLSRAALAPSGDDLAWGRALVELAQPLAGPVRSALLAVAGELFLGVSEFDEARRAVDAAVAADPSRARALAARASVALSSGERAGTDAMERAMAVIVPRARLCEELANAYDRLGEPLLALAFGQRRIALRPGDLEAARGRLLRAQALGDVERLADALTWLFAQPQPLEPLAELVADALRTLAARDSVRGAALARRALDVLGPQQREIRLAVLAVADTTADRALGLAVLERWLASGASGERVETLLDVARRRRAAGDSDGSARALARAIREGASGTAVLAELDVTPPPATSDGEIALLFARAEALSAQSEADPHATALAWRELGAAHADLASDPESAMRAFERASALDPELGVENLASDLLAFLGLETALPRLEALAAERTDPREGARVLAVAAALALDAGRAPAALGAGLRALELDASRADVLSVIERAAADSDIELLERTYALLAAGVLGRYGARSVHYRAARQLERRRAPRRALAHAISAFEAVPSEGVVFVMLARLAEGVGERDELARVLERAAGRESSELVRARWLARAALLASSGEEGLRLRVDVLLRALHVRPELTQLGALEEAARSLLAVAPDEREALALRLERALDLLAERLEGAEGARLALASARLFVDTLDLPKSAMLALEHAVRCDAGLDEYAALCDRAPRLASAAGDFVDRVASLAVDAEAHVGSSVLAFAARLAEERGELRLATELLLRGWRKLPDDPELLGRAERIASELGAHDLVGEVLEARASLPGAGAEERAELLVRAARAATAHGTTKTQALERAERAALLAPRFAPAQLLFRELEYREGRARSGGESAQAVEALSALTELDPPDAELAAFLLAEARDAAGGNTGLAELMALNESLGPRPLVALALAERLSRTGQVDQALGYFDIALNGDLRGLREPAELALQAADAARLRGERERARGYLEIAAEDPKLVERVANIERELRVERGAPRARFRPSIDPSVLVSERTFTDVGRYSERPPLEAREERPLVTVLPLTLSVGQERASSSVPAPRAPVRSSPLAVPPRASRASSPPPPPPSSPPPSSRPTAPPPSSRPTAPPSSSRPTPPISPVPSAPPRASAPAPSALEPPEAPRADASSSRHFALSAPEAELYLALDEGSIDAGRALVRRLEGRPERTRELVAVCRRLSAALPGDLEALGRLHDAALADKNQDYARALEHAIHALDPGSERIPPPPLTDQLEQPDAVRMLLLRELSLPALEALALVWEGAEHVFRREPATYGVTGLERVPFSAPNPLARVYSAAARALALHRTPLFHRRSAGPVTVSLALLSPPSVVLSGEVREESPELAYQIGAMLIATLPQFALLLGAPESQVRAVLSGLGFAFGSPDHAQVPGKVPNNLAELLWESIPARFQRRLSELCSSRERLDYESAMRTARLAGRRTGLFTSGDLRVALTETCVEEGIPPSMLDSTTKLAELCASSAEVRSLILLATSAEYAQTRWQPARQR